eukprot:6173787-Prymnesium_polylepis.1
MPTRAAPQSSQELARRAKIEHARRLQLAQLALHEDARKDAESKAAEKAAKQARLAARRQAETYSDDECDQEVARSDNLWDQETQEKEQRRAEEASKQAAIARTQEALGRLAKPRPPTESELLEQALEASLLSFAPAPSPPSDECEGVQRVIEESRQVYFGGAPSLLRPSDSDDLVLDDADLVLEDGDCGGVADAKDDGSCEVDERRRSAVAQLSEWGFSPPVIAMVLDGFGTATF